MEMLQIVQILNAAGPQDGKANSQQQRDSAVHQYERLHDCLPESMVLCGISGYGPSSSPFVVTALGAAAMRAAFACLSSKG